MPSFGGPRGSHPANLLLATNLRPQPLTTRERNRTLSEKVRRTTSTLACRGIHAQEAGTYLSLTSQKAIACVDMVKRIRQNSSPSPNGRACPERSGAKSKEAGVRGHAVSVMPSAWAGATPPISVTFPKVASTRTDGSSPSIHAFFRK